MSESTLMPTYARLDVAFESGQGVWLNDTQGEQYLDAISGIGVCNLGHGHPAVTEALCGQAKKLIHTSNLYGIPNQQALYALVDLFPACRRARDGGSELRQL